MTSGELGKLGENLAEKYYTENGYEIIERNFRYDHDEIDLIVKSKTTIAFVEVKTRTESKNGKRPADAVNMKKRKCLIKCALGYMRTHKSGLFHRFDVIEITVKNDGTALLNPIKNAFDSYGRTI